MLEKLATPNYLFNYSFFWRDIRKSMQKLALT